MYTKRRRRKVRRCESGDYRVDDNETNFGRRESSPRPQIWCLLLLSCKQFVGLVFLIAAGEPHYKMLSSPSVWVFAAATALIRPSLGQFPPTPEGVTVLNSKFDENITISYKEVCPNFSFIVEAKRD